MQNKAIDVHTFFTQLLDLELESTVNMWQSLAALLEKYLDFEALTVLQRRGEDITPKAPIYQFGDEEVRVRSAGGSLFSESNFQDVFPDTPLILNYSKKAPGRYNSMLLLPLTGVEPSRILLKFGNNTADTFHKSCKSDYQLIAAGLSLWCRNMVRVQQNYESTRLAEEPVVAIVSEPVADITPVNNAPASTSVENYHAISKLIELLPHVIETRNQLKLRRLATCLQEAWLANISHSEPDMEY